MLPSYIDASTFGDSLRNHHQHSLHSFENEEKYLILDIFPIQSDNLGIHLGAPRSASTELTLPRSFDNIELYSPISFQMTSTSNQEEIEKASLYVTSNSWLTFGEQNPLIEPDLFNAKQFPNPEACFDPRPLNPPISLRREISRGKGKSFLNSVTESFVAAAPPHGWIDLEPTPLPSGFATKRKNLSMPNVDAQYQKHSKTFSVPGDEYENASSMKESTSSRLRGMTLNDEPSIISSSDSSRPSPTADLDQNGSLLHESCRLYPTTRAVVESALRLNPSSIRQRRNPLRMSPQFGKKEMGTIRRLNMSPYPTGCTVPLNIALENAASLDVVKLLVDACPDVILVEDGPQACGSLSVALHHSSENDVVLTLIATKPESVKIIGRRHSNLPLHVACAKGASFEVIRMLVQLFPQALYHRNFHGQTPLDICQRHSNVCSDQVTDFLQEETFRNASSDLETVLDDALDVGNHD